MPTMFATGTPCSSSEIEVDTLWDAWASSAAGVRAATAAQSAIERETMVCHGRWGIASVSLGQDTSTAKNLVIIGIPPYERAARVDFTERRDLKLRYFRVGDEGSSRLLVRCSRMGQAAPVPAPDRKVRSAPNERTARAKNEGIPS